MSWYTKHSGKYQVAALCAAMMASSSSFADAFGFDRPGEGMGTEIVPKARLAWEQSLPTASYDEFRQNGEKNTVLTLQSDVLLRLGVGSDTELRLGWDGQVWEKHKQGSVSEEKHKQGSVSEEKHGVGDVTLGIKRGINTHDDRFSWALLAQVNLANGDEDFTVDKKVYTLGSAIDYQYSDQLNTTMTMYYELQDSHLAWSAIPGLQYKITDRVSGFSEYIYHKQESQRSSSVVNNGIIWSIKDNLQADLSVGYSFTAEQPQYLAGLGVAYLF